MKSLLLTGCKDLKDFLHVNWNYPIPHPPVPPNIHV